MESTAGWSTQGRQQALRGFAAGVTMVAAVAATACTPELSAPAAASSPPPALTSSAEATAAPEPAAGSAAAPELAGDYNEADVIFVRQMIPHHREAVTMSTEMIKGQGIDPTVVQLATRIRTTQQSEIDKMTALLDQWGGPTVAVDHEASRADDGSLTPAEMQRLQAADGTAAQLLYLEAMINHHRGADRLCSDVLRHGTSPAITELAQTMVATQQEELVVMQRLLISV